MIKLKVKPPEVFFECPLEVGYRAQMIPGCVYDRRRQCFKVSFGPQQLKDIKRVFPDAIVVEGQESIDNLKNQINRIGQAIIEFGKTNPDSIQQREFKIKPFKHQLDGLFYLDLFDSAALFADCGCVSRNTLVRLSYFGSEFDCFIDALWENIRTKKWNPAEYLILSFDEDAREFVFHEMEAVIRTPPKKIYRVAVKINHNESDPRIPSFIKIRSVVELEATNEHEFLTPEGWRTLENLEEGDEIMLVRDNKPLPFKIASIESQGTRTCYDIVCKDPHRNYLANGIIVHNSGKTAMTLWDIEQKYKTGRLKPSSVLIVGKLMTLHSGWKDDTEKFTRLTARVLWEPTKTRERRGEVLERIEHGPKPPGESKSFRRTEYRNHDGSTAIIASRRQFSPKKHVAVVRSWKEVNSVKYGCETVVVCTRENLGAKDIRENIRSHDDSIQIINHEGLIRFEKELTERRYEMIVVDESTAIKNPKSKIFQALCRIAASTCKYRRILSGTPSPQGPQDLWSQFYFLDSGITLGSDYEIFINQNFDVVQLGSKAAGTFRGYKVLISAVKNTMGFIHSRLSNRVFRCKLRDCVDLPPIFTSKLDVFLTEDQRKHYDTMSNAFFAEIDGKRIEVTIDLAKIGKLRQITGGFLLGPDGEVMKASTSNPKLDVLLDFLSEIEEGEKVVIFAVFRCEIEMLLRTFGRRAVAIYGGISDKKKLDAQESFKKDPAVTFIICQPQSAAYGVNGLTVARYLIFYSFDYRADTNYQAIKRIERTGQDRTMFVKYLCAKNTIDDVIYNVIHKKDETQQDTIELLRMIKEAPDADKG